MSATHAATAAVLRRAGAPFEIRDVEFDAPGPGEVLVRIVASGVCHSDIAIQQEDLGLTPLPAILGHEGAGVVEAVGDGVGSVKPGDHVVLTFDSCGGCGNCETGLPSYCDEFIPRNLMGLRATATAGARLADGTPVTSGFFGQSSWSSLAIATERNIVRLDDDVPLDVAGPLGCGLQTGAGAVLETLDVGVGDSFAVFGAGTVGLAAVLAARDAGATTIVAVDLHPERLELARELGATHTFDGLDPDLVAQVQAESGGCDHALDTTGVDAVVAAGLQVLRARGHLALVAGLPSNFDLNNLLMKRMSYLMSGDSVPRDLIPRLVALWRDGRFPFDCLVERFPLAAVNEAIEAQLAGKVVKPVLVP